MDSGRTEHAMNFFIPDIQRDFAARADWCVTPAKEAANHNPSITIKEGLDITGKPGEWISLNAETSDPDGDYVTVDWYNYVEAGTYRSSKDTDPSKPSSIPIVGKGTRAMSFVIPEDAKNGDTIHMIAKATDDGEHNLMYYQRVVITVTGADTIDSVTVTVSPEEVVPEAAVLEETESEAEDTTALTETAEPEEIE